MVIPLGYDFVPDHRDRGIHADKNKTQSGKIKSGKGKKPDFEQKNDYAGEAEKSRNKLDNDLIFQDNINFVMFI